MSDAQTQRELGALSTEVKHVRADLDEVRADVKTILEKINQVEGGGRLLLWGGAGVAGLAGSWISKKLGLG